MEVVLPSPPLATSFTRVGTTTEAIIDLPTRRFISITMVFLNKQLLKSKQLKLDAPIFTTTFQCFVAVVLCHFVSFLSRFRKDSKFPSLRFDQKISREVLPVSICFVLMITFNNLCLRELGVAFYNMGRSLTTLFNVALSYFVLKRTTPPLALLCCLVIIAGYLLGVSTEGSLVDLSYSGVWYGIVSSLFVSLNAILTSRVLPAVDQNLWRLGYYNNLNSCILMLPVLLMSGDISALRNYPGIFSGYLWFVMVTVGVFGFMTGFISTWQIQVTTPLTHNISGTAKACAQTILAVVYYQMPKTALWWLSNMMVLGGSFFYAVVRRSIMKQNHDEKVKYENENKVTNQGRSNV
ncbi:GDP-fucose transporter 1-like isoform X1 [Clavelina lepadiformis]|uniref:GDP-fucose transporter 1-like isoform X1 n=1 Tax=Clavelina lepadiformis TaxID=159417 RepID=UPI00404209D8